MDAHRNDDTQELTVSVETAEHEVIELGGCSSSEVDAKLREFQTWAS